MLRVPLSVFQDCWGLWRCPPHPHPPSVKFFINLVPEFGSRRQALPDIPFMGFPGGSVVKDAGDMGSVPGLGQSHILQRTQACVLQLLNPRALEPVLHSKRSHCKEKPARRNQREASQQ